MSYPEIAALLGATYDENLIHWINRKDEQIRDEMWRALGLGAPGLSPGTVIYTGDGHRAEVMFVGRTWATGAQGAALVFVRYPSGMAATLKMIPSYAEDLRRRLAVQKGHETLHGRKTLSGGVMSFGEHAVVAGADLKNNASMSRVFKAYLREKGLKNVRIKTSQIGTGISLGIQADRGEEASFRRIFGGRNRATIRMQAIEEREDGTFAIPADDGPMLESLFRAEMLARPEFRDTKSMPAWLRELISIVSDDLQSDEETNGLGEWIALRAKLRPFYAFYDLIQVRDVLPEDNRARKLIEQTFEEHNQSRIRI